jgi:hypothetical protein
MMKDIQSDTQLIHMLLSRLERISADSYWAHRASGVRGALLRLLENIEKGRPVQGSDIKKMMDLGFNILEKATRKMGK